MQLIACGQKPNSSISPPNFTTPYISALDQRLERKRAESNIKYSALPLFNRDSYSVSLVEKSLSRVALSSVTRNRYFNPCYRTPYCSIFNHQKQCLPLLEQHEKLLVNLKTRLDDGSESSLEKHLNTAAVQQLQEEKALF